MASMKWNDNLVWDLITLYQREPCLYAIRSPLYYNKLKKQSAIHRIAECLSVLAKTEIEPEDVKIKWNSLRTQYMKYRRDYQTSKKSGTSADDVREPKWRFWKSLQFLEDHVAERKGTSNLDDSAEEESNDIYTDYNFIEDPSEDLIDFQSDDEKENIVQGVPSDVHKASTSVSQTISPKKKRLLTSSAKATPSPRDLPRKISSPHSSNADPLQSTSSSVDYGSKRRAKRNITVNEDKQEFWKDARAVARSMLPGQPESTAKIVASSPETHKADLVRALLQYVEKEMIGLKNMSIFKSLKRDIMQLVQKAVEDDN